MTQVFLQWLVFNDKSNRVFQLLYFYSALTIRNLCLYIIKKWNKLVKLCLRRVEHFVIKIKANEMFPLVREVRGVGVCMSCLSAHAHRPLCCGCCRHTFQFREHFIGIFQTLNANTFGSTVKVNGHYSLIPLILFWWGYKYCKTRLSPCAEDGCKSAKDSRRPGVDCFSVTAG